MNCFYNIFNDPDLLSSAGIKYLNNCFYSCIAFCKAFIIKQIICTHFQCACQINKYLQTQFGVTCFYMAHVCN